MRKRLARFCGQRRVFTAVFQRYGKVFKDDHCSRYVLIYDVYDERGRYITEHMWMPLRQEDYVVTPLYEGDVDAATARGLCGNAAL